MEAIVLTALPEIVQVAAPPLSREVEELLEAKRRFISERRALWDGPVWWVTHACAAQVVVFEASYAWVLASDQLTELDPGLAGGNLSVELLLRRGNDLLWQRRAQHLPDGGGSWTYSASGVVAPGDDPAEQMLCEAQEELGLPAEALTRLAPVALVPSTAFTAIFFSAELADGFVPEESDEAEALVWAPSPDMLAPTFGLMRETWRAVASLLG